MDTLTMALLMFIAAAIVVFIFCLIHSIKISRRKKAYHERMARKASGISKGGGTFNFVSHSRDNDYESFDTYRRSSDDDTGSRSGWFTGGDSSCGSSSSSGSDGGGSDGGGGGGGD